MKVIQRKTKSGVGKTGSQRKRKPNKLPFIIGARCRNKPGWPN